MEGSFFPTQGNLINDPNVGISRIERKKDLPSSIKKVGIQNAKKSVVNFNFQKINSINIDEGKTNSLISNVKNIIILKEKINFLLFFFNKQKDENNDNKIKPKEKEEARKIVFDGGKSAIKNIYQRSQTIQILKRKRKTSIFQMNLQKKLSDDQFQKIIIGEFNEFGIKDFCKAITKKIDIRKNISTSLINKRNRMLVFDLNFLEKKDNSFDV